MHKRFTLLWLLLGLGSRLQVVASLSITEFAVLMLAPFIFIKNYKQMMRDGIWTIFILSLLVIVGCIIGSIANNSPPEAVLRGMAVTCIVACSIIVSHWILRNCPSGFKWMLLGIAISVFLSTFMFQNIGEVVQFGEDAESIRSGPLYRISRLNPLIMLPSKGWYLQTPTFVSVIAPLFMAGFAMLTTVSGRSAALGAIGFAAIVLIGGKTRRSIHKISRHFGLVVFCGIVLIGVVYVGYKVSASQGLLGAKAQAKYEQQSHGGEGGIGRLLLGGRMDSFVGFLACRDKPIVGWGPWPVDTNGYTEEFLSRFGTYEDVITLQKANESARLYGYRTGLIQCHAYITEFWVWYGIFGLLFWVYVIFVMLRYLKEDVAAVPQWFAWLACSIPGMFWGIFFSPFADRFGVPLFVVACLMARSVRKGLVQLPLEMIVEIEKAERK